MTATTLVASPFAAPLAAHGMRRGARVLAGALLLSLAVHLAITLWPVETPQAPDPTVLSATLTEMPPPPQVQAPAPTAAPKKRRKPVSPLVPAPVVPQTAEPVADPVAETSGDETVAPAAVAGDDPTGPPAPPVLAESVERAPAAPPPSMKALPPRVDLAYRVYYGPGLYIGDARYRFKHEGHRYSIATLGEARGLAALVMRGQGRIETHGLITPEGLQPWEMVVERGSRERRETVSFDWDTGIATLHEQKTAALELPSFDPLSLMWQFYFAPPGTDQHVFHIVTTRRIARITITREGIETITWPYGEVEAERWHRRSDDGQSEAIVWLAPSLRYLPVKMRVSNTLRGTVDVVLASIRVDDGERVE